PPLQAVPFGGTVASTYKPDDHYGVINFDERVIRGGQEVKGARDVTSTAKSKGRWPILSDFSRRQVDGDRPGFPLLFAGQTVTRTLRVQPDHGRACMRA
ncbi:hypothetical protein X777_10125, partial [Ooceraea biroi]